MKLWNFAREPLSISRELQMFKAGFRQLIGEAVTIIADAARLKVQLSGVNGEAKRLQRNPFKAIFSSNL